MDSIKHEICRFSNIYLLICSFFSVPFLTQNTETLFCLFKHNLAQNHISTNQTFSIRVSIHITKCLSVYLFVCVIYMCECVCLRSKWNQWHKLSSVLNWQIKSFQQNDSCSHNHKSFSHLNIESIRLLYLRIEIFQSRYYIIFDQFWWITMNITVYKTRKCEILKHVAFQLFVVIKILLLLLLFKWYAIEFSHYRAHFCW